MTRPGWAPTCTCGKTQLGYYCYTCDAWAGASHGEQSSWSKPRSSARPKAEAVVNPAENTGSQIEPTPEQVVAAIPTGVRCKNGRYARPAKAGEKVLPCGCPLTAAPRECIDAVATMRVTPRRPPIEH